jgi:threonine/homoserine/homoserine lactone efflux protein
MPDSHTLLLFALAALVLLVTPGPAVLFVVTQSLQNGRAAALVSTLGLVSGGLVHVLAAVFGLSALLASSAVAFTAIKLVGAGYLIWLGFKALVSPPPWPGADAPRRSRTRLYLDGFVVNVTNPKPGLFFLAFLPQFVDPAAGSVRLQLAVLGLLFLSMALVTDSLYGLAAASVRGVLLRRPGVRTAQRYATALVYFGLGISAALTGRRAG